MLDVNFPSFIVYVRFRPSQRKPAYWQLACWGWVNFHYAIYIYIVTYKVDRCLRGPVLKILGHDNAQTRYEVVHSRLEASTTSGSTSYFENQYHHEHLKSCHLSNIFSGLQRWLDSKSCFDDSRCRSQWLRRNHGNWNATNIRRHRCVVSSKYA